MSCRLDELTAHAYDLDDEEYDMVGDIFQGSPAKPAQPVPLEQHPCALAPTTL